MDQAREATAPGYWTRHLRQTVLFSNCLEELFRKPDRLLIEVGQGTHLPHWLASRAELA